MTVLPFGGRHASAITNLQELVPARLVKNQRLARELTTSAKYDWISTAQGLKLTRTVPIDEGLLAKLCVFLVKGLVWYHWGNRLETKASIVCRLLTDTGDAMFRNFIGRPDVDPIAMNLGNGTILYEGAQAQASTLITCRRIHMLGGVHFSPQNRTDIIFPTIDIVTDSPLIRRPERAPS